MNINNSCLSCSNSNCLIRKHCPTSIIDDIDNNKIINRYRNRQYIFHEGNFTKGVYFILSGKVKVFKKGAFKKDQIIRLSLNGDILGHRGFISKEIYPVSSQAITESKICFFSKKYFFHLLEKAPNLSINLMLFYANELHQEETKLRNMSIFNVREKVAKSLLMIIDSFGIDENQKISHIDLLSRQDIAELVGLRANQVTKILAEFKEDGLIKITAKKIKIESLESLRKLVSY